MKLFAASLAALGALTLGNAWASVTPLAPDVLNVKGTDRDAPLKRVGLDQNLNAQLPLDLPFRDDSGRDVRLGEYFGKKPVVLAFVYYECPKLCSEVLTGLARAIKVMTFEPGKEFEVVVISFDARENPPLAAAKKEAIVKYYGKPGSASGWHFLTGSLDSIKKVTASTGFRYAWDAHTNQFAHASGIMVVTPDGKLSRYFYGVEYSPKDLRFGLVDAASGKIGTPVDMLLLYCYHFDPTVGKYTPVALNILRLAGVITIVFLGGFVMLMLRRESAGGRVS